MDPNATLEEMEEELESSSPNENLLREGTDELLEWLWGGGEEPHWGSFPATKAFLEKHWGEGIFKEIQLPSGVSCWSIRNRRNMPTMMPWWRPEEKR